MNLEFRRELKVFGVKHKMTIKKDNIKQGITTENKITRSQGQHEMTIKITSSHRKQGITTTRFNAGMHRLYQIASKNEK